MNLGYKNINRFIKNEEAAIFFKKKLRAATVRNDQLFKISPKLFGIYNEIIFLIDDSGSFSGLESTTRIQ
jgi:hypothetical protein